MWGDKNWQSKYIIRQPMKYYICVQYAGDLMKTLTMIWVVQIKHFTHTFGLQYRQYKNNYDDRTKVI